MSLGVGVKLCVKMKRSLCVWGRLLRVTMGTNDPRGRAAATRAFRTLANYKITVRSVVIFVFFAVPEFYFAHIDGQIVHNSSR